MGRECEILNRRLAELLARKRKEPYSKVITYIRNRLRFSLLRTILFAVRGVRGKPSTEREEAIEDISFNLIRNVRNDYTYIYKGCLWCFNCIVLVGECA